jgi:ribosomal protein L11 methyltransferase
VRDAYSTGQRDRRADPLETIWLDALPEAAVPAFEAAFLTVCRSVALFRDEATDTWRVEGVRPQGDGDNELEGALALAEAVTGVAPALQAAPVEAEGWLARTVQSFGEQEIGGDFLIRPTHIPPRRVHGRTVLVLDAGIAFGSGEHASTRGCLVAFGRVAKDRRPMRRLLDLGTGSGILAMAAAKRRRRPVLATDIEPWSVRVAEQNARMNGVGRLVRARLADGWAERHVRAAGPTTWSSPTSWPAHSARWRGRWRPGWRPAAPRSWRGCSEPRRGWCWRRIAAGACGWNVPCPSGPGPRWCSGRPGRPAPPPAASRGNNNGAGAGGRRRPRASAGALGDGGGRPPRSNVDPEAQAAWVFADSAGALRLAALAGMRKSGSKTRAMSPRLRPISDSSRSDSMRRLS